MSSVEKKFDPPRLEEWVTLSDVAEELDVSRVTIRKFVDAGRFETARVLGRGRGFLVISTEEFDSFCKEYAEIREEREKRKAEKAAIKAKAKKKFFLEQQAKAAETAPASDPSQGSDEADGQPDLPFDFLATHSTVIAESVAASAKPSVSIQKVEEEPPLELDEDLRSLLDTL